MKPIWKYLLIVLLLNVTGLLATAQEPKIPDNAWEQHPEGVALALLLTNGRGNDSQSIYLVLYVKNTSNNPELLRGGPAFFFYLDSSGNPVNLGNHAHPDHPEKDAVEGNQRFKIILPGKMRSTGTEITAAEVTVIKTHTVKCKIILNDPTTKQDLAVLGTPRLLIP